MKLRIRCFETNETIKIDVLSSSCTLRELKNRISQAFPSSSIPNSIHLSLNRKDELQFSEEDTLQSIGITSGDLIFFTQNPIGFSISTETHIPKSKNSDTQIVKESETVKKSDTQIVKEDETVKESDTQIDQSKPHETKTQPGGEEMEEEEFMEVDDNGDYSDVKFTKSFSVPGFLRKVFTEELKDDDGGREHKLLVVAVHAVFVESGFVLLDPITFTEVSVSQFLNYWCLGYRKTLFYTLPEVIDHVKVNGSWNNEQCNEPNSNTKDWIKNSSTSTISRDASSTINQGISDSCMFSMTGFDRILDTMVSSRSAKQSLDDNVSSRTTITNLSSSSAPNASCSYDRVGVSSQIQGEQFVSPNTLLKSGAISSSSYKSECSKEDTGMYSQSSSIYGSTISSWVESGYDTKPSSSVSTGYSKKPDEMSKTNRKRLKPGENPRPRPKDRQMIQDRVKELREIVPNGAKCSIDALFERTIKHMLFLQSVTKHADKLKQTGESKIISKEGGLLLKDNLEGGATWAYEVGSQSMVCPIIVEDLNQPRQMLVEMLCEERGIFLEIADIIRGLGLTILKGVMETRNDKIWAQFAVEANRDVTRMEIFISLVRLLEQTAKGGTEPVSAADNNTAMVHSFHQAAALPATGRSCSLL